MGWRERGSDGPFDTLAHFAVTYRRAQLRDDMYVIDHSDRRHVVVHVAADLTPVEQDQAVRAIRRDLQNIARARRRADLVPVAELEDDETPTEDVGEDVAMRVVR